MNLLPRSLVASACLLAPLPLLACACSSSTDSATSFGDADTKTRPDAADADAARPEDAGHDATLPTGTHLTGQSITVDGAPRTYDISIPASCDASHLHPLVFVYHGDGGKGSDMYGAGFPIEAAAASAGDEAIFVYPDGLDNNENGSAWNIYDDPGMYPYTTVAPTGNGDVDFFDAMLAYFEAHECVDQSHVFVTGFSNGGYMTSQLARWRSKVIYGAAPQSGGPPAGSVNPSNDYAAPNYCVGTTQSVPVIIIHGSADGTVDPTNCQMSASYWDMANVCDDNAADCSATSNSLLVPPATPTTATTPSPCITSTGCKAGYPVVLCEIPGMGHSIWSEAPQTIWAFFAAH